MCKRGLKLHGGRVRVAQFSTKLRDGHSMELAYGEDGWGDAPTKERIMARSNEASFKRIRLEPDSKAAESLSRRIWRNRGSARTRVKNTAGARVYRHDTGR